MMMKSRNTFLAFALLLATGCGSSEEASKSTAADLSAATVQNDSATTLSGGEDPSWPDGSEGEEPDPNGTCDAKKVKICHIPPGNPAAKHTICISSSGATHGHGVRSDGKPGGHGGDYYGDCRPTTAPSPSATPRPSDTPVSNL